MYKNTNSNAYVIRYTRWDNSTLFNTYNSNTLKGLMARDFSTRSIFFLIHATNSDTSFTFIPTLVKFNFWLLNTTRALIVFSSILVLYIFLVFFLIDLSWYICNQQIIGQRSTISVIISNNNALFLNHEWVFLQDLVKLFSIC